VLKRDSVRASHRTETVPSVDIPQFVIDRVAERRGDYLVTDLDPRKTALVVVDLQDAFVCEEFAATHVAEAVNVVPNVNRLADALRTAGGTVYWIRHTVTDESLASWSNLVDFLGLREEGAEARRTIFRDGARGHQIYSGMDKRAEDAVVNKTRFSPFVHGSSDLHDRLRASGVDTLIIVGAVTNVCCESTLRDAMMLNYRCVMVSDANAARSRQEHVAALANVYMAFGDVMTTDEVLHVLSDGSP
jgi:ureidoacrylate peracid hydrolase